MTILVMKELAIRCFQQSLALLEKPSSDRAIDDAVIGGETHGHDRTHSNAFAVRHDARPRLADRQDSALRRGDDRGKNIKPQQSQSFEPGNNPPPIHREKVFFFSFFPPFAAYFLPLF